MNAERILIIDNEKLLTDLLKQVLDSELCEVIGVSSADEAKEVIQFERVDMIIIDPIVSGGLQLIRRLQADPDSPTLMAITSSAMMLQVVRAAGVQTIDKSGSLSEMVGSVRTSLRQDPLLTHIGGAVLLVDDDDQILTTVGGFLKERGYVVHTTTTGGHYKRCVKVIRRQPSI
jgi:DNA-binding response OmpR family regulator